MSSNICLKDNNAFRPFIQPTQIPFENKRFLTTDLREFGQIIKIINKNCRLPTKI